ncbi:MAG: cytochrome c peroxidase, partial [Cytophagales bacterium]
KDSSISCASCHFPEKAFSDAGNAFSRGIGGLQGLRNSPALFNLAWKPLFFHDGGGVSLELQAIAPIEDHLEMGNNLADLLRTLNHHSDYKKRFKEAFGRDNIETTELIFALAQFQRTLVSANSKYDKYLLGKESLSPIEKKGLNIFEEKCSSCHKPPLFTDFTFSNNGLDSEFPSLETDADNVKLGRARVTKEKSDVGKFMIPTLRNIIVTYPYMHDGRFKTLEDVINHYRHGIKQYPTLDFRVANGIQISEEEKTALLAFLETLTDHDFLTSKFQK